MRYLRRDSDVIIIIDQVDILFGDHIVVIIHGGDINIHALRDKNHASHTLKNHAL